MDNKSTVIAVTRHDNVATVTLNRPDKMNAINKELNYKLNEVMNELGQDNEVRVVVITGAGQGFCSGGDLTAANPKIQQPMLQKMAQTLISIRNMSKPVIASVNGAAVGSGCDLALACDIIIASEKARFGEVYILRNMYPDAGGTYFLPRLVGTAKALELMLTGRLVDAVEAANMGMVNRVVPAEQLETVTGEFATALAHASPLIVGLIKASTYGGLTKDLPTALANDRKAVTKLMRAGFFRDAAAEFVHRKRETNQQR